jgi:hypothetical protein
MQRRAEDSQWKWKWEWAQTCFHIFKRWSFEGNGSGRRKCWNCRTDCWTTDSGFRITDRDFDFSMRFHQSLFYNALHDRFSVRLLSPDLLHIPETRMEAMAYSKKATTAASPKSSLIASCSSNGGR